MENENSPDPNPSKTGTSDPGIESVQSFKPTETQPTAAAEFQKVKEEMNAFERSTLRWTRAMVVIYLLTCTFIALQWREMRTNSKDTNALALAAKKQAENFETAMHLDERAWLSATHDPIQLRVGSEIVVPGHLVNLNPAA